MLSLGILAAFARFNTVASLALSAGSELPVAKQ